MKLERTLAQYANCTASGVAGGSKAQMMYFVEDAKKDIATLARALADKSFEVEGLREALKSIAANTCCGGCQEAALVARAALQESADAKV